MPLFHFHLVAGGECEHIGTLDLPSHGLALPAGVRLSMKVLADIVLAGEDEEGLTVQATDDAGAVVCYIDVPRRPERSARPDARSHRSDLQLSDRGAR